MKNRRKLYCYVDESGQDDRSRVFIVVAVVVDDGLEEIRSNILAEEARSRVGKSKWHKSGKPRRTNFLRAVLHARLLHGRVTARTFPKPVTYFDAIADTVLRAVSSASAGPCRAVVTIDGIDKKKAEEITRSLRARGIRLEMIRSATDESEAFIRLADRWAGCLRAAALGERSAAEICGKAIADGYLLLLNIDQQ